MIGLIQNALPKHFSDPKDCINEKNVVDIDKTSEGLWKLVNETGTIDASALKELPKKLFDFGRKTISGVGDLF